jgi:Tfp pilus assembly protein PilF
LAEAERLIRQAIQRDPTDATAFANLGAVLERQGKQPEAEKQLRRAIALDPKHANAHFNLGLVRGLQRKSEEAVKLFSRAIELQPNDAKAHLALGLLRAHRGELAEAEQLLRRAVALDPNDANAHSTLGGLLAAQGKWIEGMASFRQALTLDPKNAVGRAQLRRCAPLAALEAELPALFRGDLRFHRNADRLSFAFVCKYTRLYRKAAGLCADAFTADGKLADDLAAEHRYDAACCAALAGCGQGEDAPKLDAKERARLRNQALGWLQADLALWARRLQGGKAADRAEVRARMRRWQQDAQLAGVRGNAALARLPATERQAWLELWAKVGALLAKAGAA